MFPFEGSNGVLISITIMQRDMIKLFMLLKNNIEFDLYGYRLLYMLTH